MAIKVIKHLGITSHKYILGLDEVLLKAYRVLWIETLSSYSFTSLFSSFKIPKKLEKNSLVSFKFIWKNNLVRISMQALKKRNSEVGRALCCDLGTLRNVGHESLAGALEGSCSAGQMGTAGAWHASH